MIHQGYLLGENLRFACAHEFQTRWIVSRSKDPVCHHVGEKALGNDVRVFTR